MPSPSLPRPPAGRRTTAFRTTGHVRRLVTTVTATLLMIGGLVIGGVAPAAADPPEIRFENRCGSVGFAWDTGTIGGGDAWPTTVLRDGTLIDEFVMGARGDADYAARDGEVFEIRREGLPERTFVHRSPDGCVDAPLLAVSPANECFSLMLVFVNEGTAPVTGLQVLVAGAAPRDVGPRYPGRTETHHPVGDGERFYVRSPLAGGGWVTWLTGIYDRPERCTPDSVEVRYTDGCDGVRIDLANAAAGVIRVTVQDGDRTVGATTLAPGGTGRIDVVAAAGTELLVRDVVAGNELGRYVVAEPACGTPTPTEPTPTGPALTEPGGSVPPGAGGGLPVTGAQTALLSGAGVLLVGVGVVLFLVARRRRLRFTPEPGR